MFRSENLQPLVNAHCMKIRTYCDKDFPVAAELRKHIKKKIEYIQ